MEDIQILNKIKKVKDATDFIVATAISGEVANSIADYIKDQIYNANAKFLVEVATSSPTADSIAHRIENIQTDVTDLVDNRVTSTRASYFDNLAHTLPFQYTTNVLKIYPYKAGSVSVDTGLSWAEGNWTEVVPASTITNAFIIVGIIVSAPDAQGANAQGWVIDIGTGAGGAESVIGSTGGIVNDTPVYPNMSHAYNFPTPFYCAANTRVAARASLNHNVKDVNALVKIVYYELPLA